MANPTEAAILAQLSQMLAAHQLTSDESDLRITVEKAKAQPEPTSAQAAVTAAVVTGAVRAAVTAELQPVTAGLGDVSSQLPQLLTTLQDIQRQLQAAAAAQQAAAAAAAARDVQDRLQRAYMHQRQFLATQPAQPSFEYAAKDALAAFSRGHPFYSNDHSVDHTALCDLMHALTGVRPRYVAAESKEQDWTLHLD